CGTPMRHGNGTRDDLRPMPHDPDAGPRYAELAPEAGRRVCPDSSNGKLAHRMLEELEPGVEVFQRLIGEVYGQLARRTRDLTPMMSRDDTIIRKREISYIVLLVWIGKVRERPPEALFAVAPKWVGRGGYAYQIGFAFLQIVH